MIGGYNLITNTRSDFVYKTHGLCQGYFMRRERLKRILDYEDHKILAGMFKKRLIKNYKEEIMIKL